MAYYNNISTTSSKEISNQIEKFFTEWAYQNNCVQHINALMRNYDYCVERNRKGSNLKLYNLLPIKKGAPPQQIKNFTSVVTDTAQGIPEKLEKFMTQWAKANECIVQIEALIEDYNKCAEANYKKEEEGRELRLFNLKNLLRIQICDDNIKWFCIPQKCRTQNNKLVCMEENGWSPISLDEVNLIFHCPEDLISPVITDEAKGRGVEIPKYKENFTFMFTSRSRYPYLIQDGLLFCRKWVSSNLIAAQKIILSETYGDTRVIIGENNKAVILNKIIALYPVVEEDRSELCLIDEFGTKQIINFNVDHEKCLNHNSRELPVSNIVINVCVARFVRDLIIGQMTCNIDETVAFLKMKDRKYSRLFTLLPKFFDFRDNKFYLKDQAMFEIEFWGENDRIFTLLPKLFDYRDSKLYLGDQEMFEIELWEDCTGIFKNT